MLVKIQSHSNFHPFLMKMKNGTSILEEFGSSLKSFTHNSATTLSGISLNYLKTISTQNLHTNIYAALYLLSKKWKQPRLSLVNECVNTLWYIYMIKQYSHIKINDLSSYGKTQINLKCIVLNEKRQSEKVAYCLILTIHRSGKGQNY